MLCILNIYKSFNLDKTKVSKWMKNKNSIIQAASEQQKKKLFKIRPGTKYQSLFRDLLGKFKDARSKGRHVDFNWLWSKGRKIYREQTVDENAVLKEHVIANFIKINNLKQRKIQRNKRITTKVTWRNDIQHCEREPFGQVLVNQIMMKNGEDICLYNLSMGTSHLFLLLEIQLKHMSR